MTKRTISTELYKTPRYSDDKNPPPRNAHDFMVWLQGLIDSVPEAHRAAVGIEFDDDGDCDSPHPELTIWWWREETDAEYASRLSAEQAEQERRAAAKIAEERAQFEKLKAKFGNG